MWRVKTSLHRGHRSQASGDARSGVSEAETGDSTAREHDRMRVAKGCLERLAGGAGGGAGLEKLGLLKYSSLGED